MKKTAALVGGIVLSLSSVVLHAQTWEAKRNATVDSITSKYKDKVVVSKPAPGLNEIFPVIGNYEPGAGDANMITISLDEQNKGIVWIDGLPQGRIKALLRKSPATYKIPAQKTVDEKAVAEGTMIYDKEENKLHIVIGKTYDETNPISSISMPETEEATSNTKLKVGKKIKQVPEWRYTGMKIVVETVIN